jgi:hypothetical protein
VSRNGSSVGAVWGHPFARSLFCSLCLRDPTLPRRITLSFCRSSTPPVHPPGQGPLGPDATPQRLDGLAPLRRQLAARPTAPGCASHCLTPNKIPPSTHPLTHSVLTRFLPSTHTLITHPVIAHPVLARERLLATARYSHDVPTHMRPGRQETPAVSSFTPRTPHIFSSPEPDTCYALHQYILLSRPHTSHILRPSPARLTHPTAPIYPLPTLFTLSCTFTSRGLGGARSLCVCGGRACHPSNHRSSSPRSLLTHSLLIQSPLIAPSNLSILIILTARNTLLRSPLSPLST